MGSLSETLRVKLLSSAQARHAPTTDKGPTRLVKLGPRCHDRITAPATILAMPRAIRLSKFSRNTNQGTSAVNTTSILSSTDADEAGVLVRPNINSTGPTTPPVRIASPSQAAPFVPKGSLLDDRSTDPTRRQDHTTSRPMPEPR